MAYEPWSGGTGTYVVDWDTVAALVKSHQTAKLQMESAQTKKASETRWWNPFSWSMPDVEWVEVDWDRVRDMSQVMSAIEVVNLINRSERNMRTEANHLRDMVRETGRVKERFLNRLHSAQQRNSREIEKSVQSYETQIGAAKFVRDTSAGTLMVGATFLSGGAAAAVVGVSSGLKGVAKFQDTGSLGAATLEATGNMIFWFIPVKAKASGAELSKLGEGVLLVVEAGWETGTSLVEGKTLVEALGTGGLKLTGPAVDKLFDSGQVKEIFERAAIPAKIDVGEFLRKQAAMMTKKQIEQRGGDFISQRVGRKRAAAQPNRARGPGSVARSALLDQERLLQLAIVHTDKGIGNGW
ncbi:MAG: hypothetical protein ACE5FG_15095 [Myxococcota bacterium]